MSDDRCHNCDRPKATSGHTRCAQEGSLSKAQEDCVCWREQGNSIGCDNHRVNWRDEFKRLERAATEYESHLEQLVDGHRNELKMLREQLAESNRERDDAMWAHARDLSASNGSMWPAEKHLRDRYPTHAARLYPEGRTSDAGDAWERAKEQCGRCKAHGPPDGQSGDEYTHSLSHGVGCCTAETTLIALVLNEKPTEVSSGE